MIRTRAGFSMVEILVVLVILVGLVALIAPGMVGEADRSRVDASASSLRAIANAIHDPSRGAGSFRTHVGVYPGRLSHLATHIVPGQPNSCGSAYTDADTAGWNGPYLNRLVPTSGVPLPIGTVSDTIQRDPPSGGENAILKLVVRGVAPEAASALDTRVDGVANGGAGTVRWGAADAEGFVTLEYVVPSKNC